MSNPIVIETLEGATVIRLSAGENRFGLPFTEALAGAIATAEGSGMPIVLTGTGKYFSNGLDVEWIGREAARLPQLMSELHAVLGRLLVASVPTAAAINGHAFGAGAMLAAACDYRVMREDRGYFCFPEVDMGLTMSDGFNALLQSKYSKESLHQAWTTGQRYGGADAVALGFVHETAPESEVLSRAVTHALRASGKNPNTLAALKRQLHAYAAAALLGNESRPQGQQMVA